jgi:hypothetical protein
MHIVFPEQHRRNWGSPHNSRRSSDRGGSGGGGGYARLHTHLAFAKLEPRRVERLSDSLDERDRGLPDKFGRDVRRVASGLDRIEPSAFSVRNTLRTRYAGQSMREKL